MHPMIPGQGSSPKAFPSAVGRTQNRKRIELTVDLIVTYISTTKIIFMIVQRLVL